MYHDTARIDREPLSIRLLVHGRRSSHHSHKLRVHVVLCDYGSLSSRHINLVLLRAKLLVLFDLSSSHEFADCDHWQLRSRRESNVALADGLVK